MLFSINAMFSNIFYILFACIFICNINASGEIKIKVDCNQSFVHSLKHFWKSTGLCPPDPKTEIYKFLLSDDEKLNLAFIGALPHKAITHVRIHWLINLIFIQNETSLPRYNFTYLDRLLDWLHDQKLYPGFELMGTPILTQSDGKLALFKRPPSRGKDIYKFWYSLVIQTVERYIERYRFKYVKKWRFETWNEPDLANYNILNFTLHDYLQYVRGSAAALDAISSQRGALKLGGPAGLFKDPKEHPLCWGLLRRCNKGKRRACPIKFVSFHEKGEGTATQVLNKSVELLDVMYSKFPNVRRLPIANDEADILTDWSKSEEWRGDVRYAAMIAKVAIDYFKGLVKDRKEVVEVLSNDNGFLNYHPYYFTQRTLLARFQMNDTIPPHRQFIKKPSYMVMGLLSLLGEEYLQEDVERWDPLVDFLASISRRNKHKSEATSLLITYVNNTEGGIDKRTKGINAVFNNLPDFDSKYVIYVMDNLLTNPFLLWKDAGSPAFPPKSLRETMRRAEEPFRFRGPASVVNSTLEVQMNLTLPSVALIHVCSRSSEPPGRVTHLKAYNVTRNEVLLIWKDTRVGTKCISTYEIEFSPESQTEGSHFRRINKKDTIFLSYHHAATGMNNNLLQFSIAVIKSCAMFHCYRLDRHDDNIQLLSCDTSMVSVIKSRSNYSTVLTIGLPHVIGINALGKCARSRKRGWRGRGTSSASFRFTGYMETAFPGASSCHLEGSPLGLSIEIPMVFQTGTDGGHGAVNEVVRCEIPGFSSRPIRPWYQDGIRVSYSRKNLLQLPRERTVIENSISQMKWIASERGVSGTSNICDNLTTDITAKCADIGAEETEVTSCDVSVSVATMAQSRPEESRKIKRSRNWRKMSAKILDCNCFKGRPANGLDDEDDD